MLKAPPPPPPQPPAVLPLNYNLKKPINLSIDDEIREALMKSGFGSPKAEHVVRYRRVQSIIQEGPTCGLVALAMMFDQPADEIVKTAFHEKFSINGEMFSCVNMENLMRMTARRLGVAVEITRKVGNLCCNETIEALLDGALMLVPYDSYHNHEPTMASGHKAHWALIVGIVTVPGETPLVLARHGKSARLAAWKLDILAMSNCNLMDLSPARDRDDLTYVIPPGGLGGEYGLCRQYIIVKFNE